MDQSFSSPSHGISSDEASEQSDYSEDVGDIAQGRSLHEASGGHARDGQTRGSYRDGRYRNSGEMLSISSGYVFAIDQFMLGNSQFITRSSNYKPQEECPNLPIAEVVAGFGGLVFEIPNGRYQVVRDPRASLILLVAESEFSALGGEREAVDGWFDFRANADLESCYLGKVALDTRCLVLADLKLLESPDALEKYREYRLERQEKAARDYLRELGAAVRYGFSWRGEEFNVFGIPTLSGGQSDSNEAEVEQALSSGLTRQAVALQIRR